MLSAEQFIKNHSLAQKQKLGENWANLIKPKKYDLKLYKTYADIARDLNISRQTVAKKLWVLWFHTVEVGGVEYYVKDKDIIKFAFYLLTKKTWGY